jgi:hypothetical protein
MQLPHAAATFCDASRNSSRDAVCNALRAVMRRRTGGCALHSTLAISADAHASAMHSRRLRCW